MRFSWLFSFSGALIASTPFVVGCSSQPKTVAKSASRQDKGLDPNRALNPSELSQVRRERLIPMAFGNEGFPRVKRYNQGDQLERIEYDFNGDGRVDLVQWYDETGQWVKKESAATRGDGVLNVTSHFEKDLSQKDPQLVMEESDALSVGHPNVWKYFKNGQLVRRDLDRHGLGRPDYSEFFENNHLVRIEKDEISDTLPNSRLKLKSVVSPRGTEPGKIDTPSQNL